MRCSFTSLHAPTAGVYEKLGFPGAVCSIDGVHIAWNRAYCTQTAAHTGKEGYPIRVFNVTCDHSRRVLHVIDHSHPGARNDKTVVRSDHLVMRMYKGELYSDVKYKLARGDGTTTTVKGLYALVDGGYHSWRCLMAPIKVAQQPKVQQWSKRLESVRKDFECLFGILKRRFRLLRLPIDFQDTETLDNIFKTCCMLHNMLLVFDGLDTIGQEECDWTAADLDLDERRILSQRAQRDFAANSELMHKRMHEVSFGAGNNYPRTAEANEAAGNLLEDMEQPSHYVLRDALIEHFHVQYVNRNLLWARSAKAVLRARAGLPV
eukprot:1422947-Pleurochrysis_carterae.AAC.2